MSNTKKKLLLRAIRTLEEFRSAIQELENIWQSNQKVNLWWDEYRSVFSSNNPSTTYRLIYGNLSLRWMRDIYSLYGKTGNYECIYKRFIPINIKKLRLPDDVVIIPCRNGCIIISAKSRKAVKLHYSDALTNYQRELKAWEIAINADITHRIPDILKHGLTKDKIAWIVTELVPNNKSLSLRLKPIWRKYLREEILPLMEKYYNMAGISYIDEDETLDYYKSVVSG